MALEQYYTVPEVASALKVDERTVRAWIESGKIQGIKIGRQYRIPASAIEASKQIYCRWIDQTVSEDQLPQECKKFFQGSICTECEISPQLALGMPWKDLLRNLNNK